MTCWPRLVSDVDATQDLFIRGIAPPLAAALVGAGSAPTGPRCPAASGNGWPWPGPCPDLLILDEPTGHLDAATRRALMRDLLAATAGRTMLLITRDLDGLDELDQVIVLDRGKIAGFHPAGVI